MLATVPSAVLLGVEGRPVRVEVHVSNGLPGFTVVGLPDTACRESRDRVRAALLSSSLPWPLRRVTVNLAPSGLRKQGPGLDLAIAVALLAAAGELPPEAVGACGFLGELGLDGTVRPVVGTVPLVDAVGGVEDAVVVPVASAGEAALLGRRIRPVSTLAEVVAALRGEAPWPDPPPPPPPALPRAGEPDLADVRGQRLARLALEVAAAGGHHVLLVGPPGAGKTMLAARLPGLLPDLSDEQALAVTRIHSAAGLPLPGGLVRRPPFRAPHHGASAVSLVGGGSVALRPGEISMASGGVLFLDELGEFPPAVLDALRQPLEEGVIRVARATGTATFPAEFLLVAATNPCPCGMGGPPGACRCSDEARARYARRLTGPLVDRFDLRVDVPRPEPGDLLSGPSGESTADVAARVAAARSRARERGVACNARLPAPRLDELAPLTPGALRLLDGVLRAGGLSGRGLHRIRRVARTVADLAGRHGPVTEEDVGLALSLRVDPVALGAAA